MSTLEEDTPWVCELCGGEGGYWISFDPPCSQICPCQGESKEFFVKDLTMQEESSTFTK